MGSHQAADAIVLGLGAMGSAASFQLAASGASVLGIDRFEPPHPHGSTHGDTRITRLAIGEGEEYVPLVRRSHELWREIEQQAGVELLTITGGVVLAPSGTDFLARTLACASRYGIAHEGLRAAELAERFPMFATGPDIEGYYEPEAGYVRPEAAVRSQLELARRHGARLRLGETAVRWTASATGVRVETDAGAYVADRLVVCAGPWITDLFEAGRGLFAVHRQLMHWFPIRQGYERLREMPVFVWDLGGETDGFVHLDGFYGFPAVDGPAGGVKVATESYERTTSPDGRQHPATPEEVTTMYRRCIGPYLPWLGPDPVRSVSCLYTNTRGSRFVIDRHPEHERVMLVSACSGHGFKHSAAIGEAVAQLLTRGEADVDLSPFALERVKPREVGGMGP
ncbi:MAG TPA: N-methyl-L-tryptophan oxidase [Solirubrobacteraceae bacterium]|jgi:sarcosine oxidase